MRLALTLAKRGLGQSWPNPSVGAVIVNRGGNEIAGCGMTGQGGRPHAEAVALAEAGEAARGGTLYVTLEPCSHYGKTPPCADAIIKAGVARVVYGMVDPDPRVSGAGLARLERHGVAVEQSPLAKDARWLTLGHTLRLTEGRPFVQMKLAIGSDGLVPAGDGGPVWVSAPETRAFGHLLRAQSDAIAVGAGTVKTDNPQLTCRLPGLFHRSPIRVIFASQADVPTSTRLFEDIASVPVWILTAAGAPRRQIEALEAAGARILQLEPDSSGQIPLQLALRALAQRGITRLFVEGGPTLAKSFLQAGVVDEFILFHARRAAGPGGLLPFGNVGLELLEKMTDLHLASKRRMADDEIRFYRRSI